MSSRAIRLYVGAVTLLMFFVLWAVVAAKPWASTGKRAGLDPRLVALDRRQHRLEREARLVRRQLDRRWSNYRQRLRQREARIHMLERRHAAQVAAAQVAAGSASAYASGTAAQVVTLPPQVRVVTLPPASSPATGSGSSHP